MANEECRRRHYYVRLKEGSRTTYRCVQCGKERPGVHNNKVPLLPSWKVDAPLSEQRVWYARRKLGAKL